MVSLINGQLTFCYNCNLRKNNKTLFKEKSLISLLVILMGIFLLPKPALLSGISPEKLIELTNSERIRAGLSPLTVNQLLAKAALDKSQAIINAQIFKHNIGDKKFSGWVQDAGYNYSYVGENLAIDFSSSEGVMSAWENSYLHNKNLLSPYYKEIGVAAAKGNFQGQKTTVVVQIFGAPANSSVTPKIFSNNLNLPAQYQNSLFSPNILSNNQIESENLIIHSIANRLLLPVAPNKISYSRPSDLNNSLSKLFEQFNYSAYWQFLIIYTSISTILLLLYLYYFYFFKIFKPMYL